MKPSVCATAVCYSVGSFELRAHGGFEVRCHVSIGRRILPAHRCDPRPCASSAPRRVRGTDRRRRRLQSVTQSFDNGYTRDTHGKRETENSTGRAKWRKFSRSDSPAVRSRLYAHPLKFRFYISVYLVFFFFVVVFFSFVLGSPGRQAKDPCQNSSEILLASLETGLLSILAHARHRVNSNTI